ncbi:MAG: tetratricopeptide repeat protein, partial [Planctomycetota bacterium]
LFNLQEFDDSARDCEQALARNPYHYAAAVGLANCHLERKNPKQALVAFRHALELNPDLDSVRSQIELLEQEIEDSREKWQ